MGLTGCLAQTGHKPSDWHRRFLLSSVLQTRFLGSVFSKGVASPRPYGDDPGFHLQITKL